MTKAAKGFVAFSTSASKQYRTPRTLGEAYGHGVDWRIEPMGGRRTRTINRWSVVCSALLFAVGTILIHGGVHL